MLFLKQQLYFRDCPMLIMLPERQCEWRLSTSTWTSLEVSGDGAGMSIMKGHLHEGWPLSPQYFSCSETEYSCLNGKAEENAIKTVYKPTSSHPSCHIMILGGPLEFSLRYKKTPLVLLKLFHGVGLLAHFARRWSQKAGALLLSKEKLIRDDQMSFWYHFLAVLYLFFSFFLSFCLNQFCCCFWGGWTIGLIG